MNNYENLQKVLKEIFEMDKADLDFGIYRIMNQKREQVMHFIDTTLPRDIKEILALTQSKDSISLQAELEQMGKGLDAAGVDRNSAPKYIALQQQIAGAIDTNALEQEVFSHLASFFKRYYKDGDFISLRRYKKDVYAIPYEGEEVKLHWANHDQYYIKTSEYFKNYSFKLSDGKKVNFVLKEASTEQNNNKSQDAERRFAIYDELPLEVVEGVLNINFSYETHPKSTKQEDLTKQAFEAIRDNLPSDFTSLFQQYKKVDGSLKTRKINSKDVPCEVIYHHLNNFISRNSFDYFIHKDLGGFLNRELDFYIKNEVLFIDDINTENPIYFTAQLSKIKALKTVANKIITFLAQIENFQKKLWLKKKFVISTNYCITLDKIPEKYYPEIVANQAQIDEWKTLFDVEIIDVSQLIFEPFLVLDTKHFSQDFIDKLLAEFDDLDEETDGLLFNSDNFQSIDLMQEKFQEGIQNVFIDPPYNTGDDGFNYKDSYKSSSWLSMINDRVLLANKLLQNNAVTFTTIGDEEQELLATLYRKIFSKDNFFSTLIWEKKKKGSYLSGNIAKMKDYVLCTVKKLDNFDGLIGEINKETETYPCVNADNPRDKRTIQPGITSKFREENYFLEKGSVISAGNMNLVLLSDLTIENSILKSELIIEGNWRYSQDSMKEFAEKKEIYITQDLYLRRIVNTPRSKRLKDLLLRNTSDESNDFREIDLNNLNKTGWGSNEDANEELHHIFGEQYLASYPKPVKLVTLLIASTRRLHGTIFDYFAGSGTSGHATIKLNREDGGKRKYILVEMGTYFNTVTKPRIQKVIYSDNWKNGKPQDKAGISQIFKYQVLESYEDTLNNLLLPSTNTSGLLQFNQESQEEYLLKYMLDVESEGHLFNLQAFKNPFNYQLNVTENNELIPTTVDLVETFNYLIGLYVQRIQRVKDIKLVEGKTRTGEKTLVIWRNLETTSNDETEAVFRKLYDTVRSSEFDQIYINCDHHFENVRSKDDQFKVKLIEDAFFKLMFNSSEL